MKNTQSKFRNKTIVPLNDTHTPNNNWDITSTFSLDLWESNITAPMSRQVLRNNNSTNYNNTQADRYAVASSSSAALPPIKSSYNLQNRKYTKSASARNAQNRLAEQSRRFDNSISSFGSAQHPPIKNSYSKAGLTGKANRSYASDRDFQNNDKSSSINSRSLKEKLKEFGHPLRGPIVAEMSIHYLYFLIVLIAAIASLWAPYIRVFMGVLYFNVAAFTVEISRVVFRLRSNSVTPVYLSLPSFALLIIISREVHQIIMVLWYVSFLLVCLKSGSQSLQKHFMNYTLIFMTIYFLCVNFMNIFYKPDCSSFFCGTALTDPIIIMNEALLIIACAMIVIGCMMLERYIRRNALMLLEREEFMRQLYYANIDLKKQLRKEKSRKEVDLEAPLTRATMILKSVKDNWFANDEITKKEIEFIIGLLSSDQLFTPDIYQKPADSDVHDWLNGMLLPSNKVNRQLDPLNEETELSSTSLPKPDATKIPELKKLLAGTILVTTKDTDNFTQLLQSDSPSFNMLHYDKTCQGNSLYYYSWYIFRKHDFFRKFKIREDKFLCWLSKIQSGYIPGNPYHNAIHAADVTHAMHYYVTKDKIWEYLTPEELLATFIAPIIHDYAHPGVNNAYLMSVLDPLAIRYSDTSILVHIKAMIFQDIMLIFFNRNNFTLHHFTN